MEIAFLGHAAFRLRGRDVTVVTDPHPPDTGISMGKVQANIVTVSHDTRNHSYVEGVAGQPREVRGPGEYEIADVLISGVATSYEPMSGPKNTAYVFRFDDLTVCHLGGITDKLSDKQVEEIGAINVLLVPVGGESVDLGPARASEVVSQLDPVLVIPMHYATDGQSQSKLAPVDQFLREMGVKDFTPEAKLTLTKSSLPSEMRVVVLQARGA